MKKCIRCKADKDISEFNFKFKHRDIRQAQCRLCTREYIRSHYYRNKEYYLKKAHNNRVAIRDTVREYIWSYLVGRQCVDCGERDILVLEFDHRSDKYMAIGNMVTGRYSLERVKKEIGKCDIRCANCHRRKTAQSQSWQKAKFAPIA